MFRFHYPYCGGISSMNPDEKLKELGKRVDLSDEEITAIKKKNGKLINILRFGFIGGLFILITAVFFDFFYSIQIAPSVFFVYLGIFIVVFFVAFIDQKYKTRINEVERVLLAFFLTIVSIFSLVSMSLYYVLLNYPFRIKSIPTFDVNRIEMNASKTLRITLGLFTLGFLIFLLNLTMDGSTTVEGMLNYLQNGTTTTTEPETSSSDVPMYGVWSRCNSPIA